MVCPHTHTHTVVQCSRINSRNISEYFGKYVTSNRTHWNTYVMCAVNTSPLSTFLFLALTSFFWLDMFYCFCCCKRVLLFWVAEVQQEKGANKQHLHITYIISLERCLNGTLAHGAFGGANNSNNGSQLTNTIITIRKKASYASSNRTAAVAKMKTICLT